MQTEKYYQTKQVLLIEFKHKIIQVWAIKRIITKVWSFTHKFNINNND